MTACTERRKDSSTLLSRRLKRRGVKLPAARFVSQPLSSDECGLGSAGADRNEVPAVAGKQGGACHDGTGSGYILQFPCARKVRIRFRFLRYIFKVMFGRQRTVSVLAHQSNERDEHPKGGRENNPAVMLSNVFTTPFHAGFKASRPSSSELNPRFSRLPRSSWLSDVLAVPA